MVEYIEREAAIAETRKPRLTDAELRRRLAYISAADVRPVKRGTWITLTRPYMTGNTQYCSLCGENYGVKYNFCPNCGADMREES